MRAEAGLSQKELCRGICSTANLCKIENGSIKPNVYYLEALMQRLGRDMNQYCNFFLLPEEFHDLRKRYEITDALHQKDVGKAERLIRELEVKKMYKSGMNLQYLLGAKASCIELREGYTEENLDMCLRAIRVTLPNFDEDKIETYHLTRYEAQTINQIALHYCNTPGQRIRGLKVFERLKNSMDRTYVDELEKMICYGGILYNYSKYLGLSKRYEEALAVIAEGEKLCVKHGQLLWLPKFSINKGCDLTENGDPEQGSIFVAQAYYGVLLLGENNNAEAAKKYAKSMLGIEFIPCDHYLKHFVS